MRNIHFLQALPNRFSREKIYLKPTNLYEGRWGGGARTVRNRGSTINHDNDDDEGDNHKSHRQKRDAH